MSRQSAHRWRQGYQPYAPAALYSQETLNIKGGLRKSVGVRGSIVVMALCYKPGGHGFETR
jgi:hypothetical protein